QRPCLHCILLQTPTIPTHSFAPPPFFFNHLAPTDIYTLSLHDALPIFHLQSLRLKELLHQFAQLHVIVHHQHAVHWPRFCSTSRDRKSTRLNSSHRTISYAVFCLKKKKKPTLRIKQIKVVNMDRKDRWQ